MIHILCYYCSFIFDIEIINIEKYLIVLTKNLFLQRTFSISVDYFENICYYFMYLRQQSRSCQRVFTWKLHIYDVNEYEIGPNWTVSRYSVLETQLHVWRSTQPL